MKSLLLAWVALTTAAAGWPVDEHRRPARSDAVPGPAVDMISVGALKVSHGFLVSRKARIPLLATVCDRAGLKSLAYVIRLAPLDSSGRAGLEKEQKVPVQGLAEFNHLRARVHSGFAWARSLLGLKTPPLRSLQEFHITPEDSLSSLDLTKLSPSLSTYGPAMPLPRLRMRLWLEATNNAVTPGPGVGRSEPVEFFVVPEIDLLLEVAKHEEILEYRWKDRVVDRIDRAYQRLLDSSDRLRYARAEDLAYLSLRTVEARERLDSAREAAQEILADYERILRELTLNRVRPEMIERLEKSIVGALDKATNRDLVKYAESIDELKQALAGDDPAEARKAVDKIIPKATAQLNDLRVPARGMRELATRNEYLRVHRVIEALLDDGD
jgi:hypothetical protein